MRKLFCISGLLFSAQLFAGDRMGNGGNDLSAELVARGNFALVQIQAFRNELALTTNEIELFKAAIIDTRHERTTETLRDDDTGDIVAAKTVADPKRPGKKLIIFNETDWKAALKENRSARVAGHEYFRASGIDDNNYRLSGKEYFSDLAFIAWSQKILAEYRSTNKIEQFSDGILGEFIVGPANQGTEDPALKAEAIKSYDAACAEWKENVRKPLGALAARIVCGVRKDDKPLQNNFFNRTMGYHSYSYGSVILTSAIAVRRTEEDVASDSISCGKDCRNLDVVAKAAVFKETMNSYIKNCAAWKDSLRASFQARFIFASCTSESNKLNDVSDTYFSQQLGTKGVYYILQ